MIEFAHQPDKLNKVVVREWLHSPGLQHLAKAEIIDCTLVTVAWWGLLMAFDLNGHVYIS